MIIQTSSNKKLLTNAAFAPSGFANQTNKVSSERKQIVQGEPPNNLSSQQFKNKASTLMYLEYEKNKN